jgi:hypothetical protein
MPRLVGELVDQGIGVVRYLPRVYEWPPDRASAVDWEAELADGVGALHLLRDQPWLDPSQQHLLGISLGGMAAPYVARRCGAVAGIASWGSSARPWPVYAEDNLSQQLRLLQRDEDQIEHLTVLLGGWHQLLAESDMSLEEMVDILPDLGKIGVSERGFRQRSVTFWRQLVRFDPAESYLGLRCAVLAIRGSADCSSHREDQESIISAARAAGLCARAVELEGIDHSYKAADGPLESLRGRLSERAHPEALALEVARWIIELGRR